MKVYVVQGEHRRVPGTPMFVCATKEAAALEASQLVAIMCQEVGIPLPDAPHHWGEALRDVQDRIVAENELYINPDALDDSEEYARVTGMDVWIEEKDLIGGEG